MTVLHSGSTKSYAAGWENVFGGKGKRSASKASAAKPAKKAKAAKPKAAAKSAKKKPAGKKR